MTPATFSDLPNALKTYIASYHFDPSFRLVSKSCRQSHDLALVYPFRYLQAHPQTLTGQIFRRIQEADPVAPAAEIVQRTDRAVRSLFVQSRQIPHYGFAAFDRADHEMSERIQLQAGPDLLLPAACAMDDLQFWFDSPAFNRSRAERLIIDALHFGRRDCLNDLLNQLHFPDLGRVAVRTLDHEVMAAIIHAPEFRDFTPQIAARMWMHCVEEEWDDCLEAIVRLNRISDLGHDQIAQTMEALARRDRSCLFLIQCAPIEAISYTLQHTQNVRIIQEIIESPCVYDLSYEALSQAFINLPVIPAARAIAKKISHAIRSRCHPGWECG
jgi:hypothetical protein